MVNCEAAQVCGFINWLKTLGKEPVCSKEPAECARLDESNPTQLTDPLPATYDELEVAREALGYPPRQE